MTGIMMLASKIHLSIQQWVLSMKAKTPTVRMHLWLESENGLHFGLGRALLLAKIQEHGSLRRAAEELGMSYRAAWGKIKKSEEILGVKLITQGGSKKEGCQLSEAGQRFMESYLLWFEAVERTALQKAEEILPWTVTGFKPGEAGKND
jgi:molybdate transport system regulatory protein